MVKSLKNYTKIDSQIVMEEKQTKNVHPITYYYRRLIWLITNSNTEKFRWFT